MSPKMTLDDAKTMFPEVDAAYQIFAELGIPDPDCWSHVPDTWLPIVRRCLEDLIAAGWDRRLGQVKEKFGGLRIYIDGETPALSAIIERAEREIDALEG